MAYHSSVNIIPGDIIYNAASNAKLVFGMQAVHLGAHSPVIAFNGAYPSGQFNYQDNRVVNITKNGRYVTYGTPSSGIAILDLFDGSITPVPVPNHVTDIVTTKDSKHALIFTNTTPYTYAVNLGTKILTGAPTGMPTWANSNNVRAAAYGDFIYIIQQSEGKVYKFDPIANAVSDIGISHAYNFGGITFDKFGYMYLPSTSTGLGRGLNIYDISNLSTPPKIVDLTNFFGNPSANESGVTDNGIYYNNFQGALHVAKITYGSTIADITLADISPTTLATIAPFRNGCLQDRGNVIFILSNDSATAPYVKSQIKICNVDNYVSGKVTIETLAGTWNTRHYSFTVHPDFTRRKLAGTIVDKDNVPVSREVVIMERSRNRVLGTTISSAIDGTFSFELYTPAQCIVMAKGDGTEVTKLIDYVAPVAP